MLRNRTGGAGEAQLARQVDKLTQMIRILAILIFISAPYSLENCIIYRIRYFYKMSSNIF